MLWEHDRLIAAMDAHFKVSRPKGEHLFGTLIRYVVRDRPNLIGKLLALIPALYKIRVGRHVIHLPFR